MTSQYIKYRDFLEQEMAKDFIVLLQSQGIEYVVEQVRDQLGPVYGDKPFQQTITIKIRKEDFTKADALTAADAAKDLEHVDKDHYLFGFTNEELYEILSKPDEWSALDYQLARKILKDRGIVLQDEVINMMKDQRIIQLAKPEESQMGWIYAGYIMALMGGIIGAFIGWHMMTSRKVLPNGERPYSYIEGDRKHGQRIFIIGIAMTIAWALAKVSRMESFGY